MTSNVTSPEILSCLQDPIRASLKASYTGDMTNFGILESRLARVVGPGCAAGREAVVNALIDAVEPDSEVLVPSLMRVVLDAVMASCQ